MVQAYVLRPRRPPAWYTSLMHNPPLVHRPGPGLTPAAAPISRPPNPILSLRPCRWSTRTPCVWCKPTSYAPGAPQPGTPWAWTRPTPSLSTSSTARLSAGRHAQQGCIKQSVNGRETIKISLCHCETASLRFFATVKSVNGERSPETLCSATLMRSVTRFMQGGWDSVVRFTRVCACVSRASRFCLFPSAAPFDTHVAWVSYDAAGQIASAQCMPLAGCLLGGLLGFFLSFVSFLICCLFCVPSSFTTVPPTITRAQTCQHSHG